MPFTIFRRKSRSANMNHIQPTTSFPAGEAHPVRTDGPEPIYSPSPQPRPRSSWYSQPGAQPSISYTYDKPNSYSAHVSPMPAQRLTSNALRSLDQAVQQAASATSSWEDCEPESPRGTSLPGSYRTLKQKTAVSQYLRDRAWEHSVPSAPTLAPPPIPQSSLSAARRFSFSSDTSLTRKERPLSYLGPRRETTRSRSSITTLPYPIHEHTETADWEPTTPTPSERKPSLTFSSPFRRSSRSNQQVDRPSPTPYTPTPASAATTIFTDPFVATPYEHTRQGPSPIHINTITAHFNQPTRPEDKNSALIKGLNKTYVPKQPPSSYRSTTGVLPVHQSPLPILSELRQTAPPSCQPRSQAYQLLHPSRVGPTVLKTRTRDPYKDSNQGCWLSIGTLHGPTPSGVRMIDGIMAKSVEKKGNTEKGLKEVRKWLKHESRGVIEWTEIYLRSRWGSEL